MRLTTAVLAPAERVRWLPAYRTLLQQLSPQVADLSDEQLTARLTDARIAVVIALDGDALLGIATLSVAPTVSHGPVGHVDDVVVDAAARGTGVGRALMEAVHAEARRLGLRHVDLTSRPSREAANALYRSMGYELRPTNPYRLRF